MAAVYGIIPIIRASKRSVIKVANKDTITKEYIQDNVTFADIFNYYLYDGEKIIDPDKLTPLDTTSIALPC